MFIKDSSTEDLYLNEELLVISSKFLLLILGSPIIHTATSLLSIMTEFYSIYFPFETNRENNHLVQIMLHLIAPILLTLCAFYGLFFPLNGRKLYASFERLIYGDGLLAPCFQPFPTEHLLGGDLLEKNTW